MQNPASVWLLTASSAAAGISSWLYAKAAASTRKRLVPTANSVLRIRAAAGVYRSHLMVLGKSAWKISAPIQRDSFVPLRVGERVTIEAPGPTGCLVFRSRIVSRDLDSHCLEIERPSRIHRVERRGYQRWKSLADSPMRIENAFARIIDLSEGGIRVRSEIRFQKGDRLRLELPWGETAFGWVLSNEGDETRVRFEELIKPKSEFASI